VNITLKTLILLIGFFLGHHLIAQPDSLTNRPDFTEIKTVFQHLQGYQKMLIKTNLDSLMLNKLHGKKQDAEKPAIYRLSGLIFLKKPLKNGDCSQNMTN